MSTPTLAPAPAPALSAPVSGAPPAAWSGVLCAVDTPTDEGYFSRVFVKPADGNIQTRELPIPLLYQDQLARGHDGAFQVGNIERVWLEGNLVMGEGTFDLDDPRAAQVAAKIGRGYGGWISVDALDLDEWDSDFFMFGLPGVHTRHETQEYDPIERVNTWKIVSATLLTQPAYQEAKIMTVTEAATAQQPGLAADAGEDTGGGDAGGGNDLKVGMDVQVALTAENDAGLAAGTYGGEIAALLDDGTVRVALDDVRDADDAKVSVTVTPDQVTVEKSDDRDEQGAPASPPPFALRPPARRAALGPRTRLLSVVASVPPPRFPTSGGPLHPPAAWFENPTLSGPTKLTVTAAGRVFGHIASDRCHIASGPGGCTPMPRGGSYGYFNDWGGTVTSAEGVTVGVGKIVAGTTHPSDDRLGAAGAKTHYSDTGRELAVVRAGEDEYGIWCAGALIPGLSQADAALLTRSAISGDWRTVDGRLSLIAALAVNTPGLGVPAPHAYHRSGKRLTVTAAGMLCEPPPADPVEELADRLAERLADRAETRARAATYAATLAARAAAVAARRQVAALKARAARRKGV